MVTTMRRLILAGSFALLFAAALPARELSDYRLGDTVEADITTPVALRVVDPEGTVQLKQRESLRVPGIFRFDPATADAVENECLAAFASTRSNFLRRVEQRFRKRQLEAIELATPKFQGLVGDFVRSTKPLPITTNLAELWARGERESDVETSVLERVRAAMERPLRADLLPAGFKMLGYEVRLVAVTNQDQTITPDEAAQRGRSTPRTNLWALARARKELQAAFPPEERALGRFAAAALRFNCVPDATLTEQVRVRHTDSLFAADSYEAGQLIARRGQKVDAKIKAALEQLSMARGPVPRPDHGGPPPVPLPYRLNPWLWAGVGLALAALIVGAWQWLNRKKPVSVLPARVAGGGAPAGIISCPACDENIVIPAEVVENLSANTPAWQQRALAAERRAERAHAAIRAGVLPQFADWLKQKFVRELVSERSQMLEAQKSAAVELAELERRLDELHAPLQARLRTYEQRIADLEKSLAVKGEENRALLRAKIEMTRQRLETQRARNPLEFN